MKDEIRAYVGRLQNTIGLLSVDKMDEVIQILQTARLNGRQLFIMGNGGSASTATHMVCDIGKNTQAVGWPPFKVIGLSDNMAALTAYANDEGYASVFARQMLPFIQADDIVIGISTSGNSPNVLEAIKLANQEGAFTIGFTGFDGGQLRGLVDQELHVPSDCIEHVEDIHLMFEHLIVFMLKQLAHTAVP
ncbi:MAG: SIS domain-containing protein [Chloroflexi bacterium]|nr:SIS domain-containing protein [Chloroflexota bacterium]